MIPAGKLGGRSGRKEVGTQKKKKIKNRATGNIKDCWDALHCVLILRVFYRVVRVWGLDFNVQKHVEST